MEHVINRSIARDIAAQSGVCVLLLAALPILAVLGFALRGAVLLLIVAGLLLCALIYPMSGRFREWFKTEAEIEFRHRGLRLARDVFLHPAHSWARRGKRSVTVGADDLLLSAVGPLEAVDLPARGMRAQSDHPLFRIRRGERVVDVLSPVSGRVCESNEVLRVYPELMNERPFTQGWVVRIEPDDAGRDCRRLLHARVARAWFRREVDRAIEAAAPEEGEVESDLHRRIDSAAWQRLAPMFQQHSADADVTIRPSL